MIVYSDVVFPSELVSAYEAQGKSMRRNSVVEIDSGKTAVNVVWTQSLREYEVGIVPMPVSNWQRIEAIFEITEGGAYGMLLEDPKDSSVTDGIVKDEGGKLFLFKRYTDSSSGRTKDRKITRPRLETVTMSAGTPVLDADGSVTGVSAGATWSGRFYVPVRFMNDYIEWEIVKSGPNESRYAAGPSVVLQEIRE